VTMCPGHDHTTMTTQVIKTHARELTQHADEDGEGLWDFNDDDE
jgi:hypothetical protein